MIFSAENTHVLKQEIRHEKKSLNFPCMHFHVKKLVASKNISGIFSILMDVHGGK